jgi:hypothetical protein
VILQAISMLSVGNDRPTRGLLHLGTAAVAIRELERRDLGLLRIFLFPLASSTDEAEVFLLGLLGREAMTFAVLPDVAPVAGHTMCSVIEVLTMHTTDRAVEEPVAFFLGKLLQLLLELLLLRDTLSLRHALGFSDRVVFWILGGAPFCVGLQLSQLLFVQDSLGLALAQSLFSRESS